MEGFGSVAVDTMKSSAFIAALQAFDDYLASGQPLAASPESLMQAPIADALTHMGQIAMLRRIAACPMKSRELCRAEIVIGRVGRGTDTAETRV